MTTPTWIEVALNGAWTRAKQPHIPLSPEQIIEQAVACAKEGASVIHYHAYDPVTGQQTSDVGVNARILEAIRARVDAIVYPAVTSITAQQAVSPQSGEARYATHRALAQQGLIEWMVVDPGSVNMGSLGEAGQPAGPQGHVYVNTEASLTVALELAARHAIRPSYAVYEPGFIRLGAMLARRHAVPTPVYRLMFSDAFTFGSPPLEFMLDAYVRLLALQAPGAPWMVGGLGVDVMGLVQRTVELGGHLRVGLEDAPLGCTTSNPDLVRRACEAVQRAGGIPASGDAVRAALADLP